MTYVIITKLLYMYMHHCILITYFMIFPINFQGQKVKRQLLAITKEILLHNFISFHSHLLLTITNSSIIIFTVLQKANNYMYNRRLKKSLFIWYIFSHETQMNCIIIPLNTYTSLCFFKRIPDNFIIILVMEIVIIVYMHLIPSVKRNDFNVKCMCHLFK